MIDLRRLAGVALVLVASTVGAEPDGRIEEVVVTAQRREEHVKDVPISISVMSGDELREGAISGFDEMARFIPNVSFNTDFNSLYLRGIGSPELNVIAEQAVAYIMDGVYLPKIEYLKPGFLDIERIEVLKGPQGTLYGRNSPAGVINITTGQPTEEYVGRLGLTAGSRNLKEVEAAVSGPLTERFSLRLAASLRQQDGHTENLHDGKTLGDKDLQQGRMKLRYDLTDDLTVTAGATYFDYFIGVWAGNETYAYPDALRPVVEVLDPHFETELDRRGSANQQNRSKGHGYYAPLQIDFEYWDHTFTSVTAYSEIGDAQGGDIDGSGADLARLFADTDYEQITQELRVTSPPGRVEYVAGFFYLDSDLATLVDVPIYVTTSPDGPADNLHGDFTVDNESKGVFGQLQWNVFDWLHLIGGIRYSVDDKVAHGVADPQGPIWLVLVQGGYDQRRTRSDSDVSPKASLTWEVTEEITAYATYAQGFRAGSFNIAALAADQFEFDAESTDSYEFGLKTELFDQRVRFNIGGFRTSYDNLQLLAFNGLTYIVSNAEEAEMTGAESDATALLLPGLVLNAALGYNDANFVKFTKAGCPTPAITDVTNFPPQGPGTLPPDRICDLSGEPLHRAPDWTTSARLDYTFQPLPWSVDFFVGGDAVYKGFEFFDADLDPTDTQRGYWLFDGNVGFGDPEGLWRVEFHAKNLTDELVKVFSGDVPLQGGAHWALTNPPRSYQVALRLSF